MPFFEAELPPSAHGIHLLYTSQLWGGSVVLAPGEKTPPIELAHFLAQTDYPAIYFPHNTVEQLDLPLPDLLPFFFSAYLSSHGIIQPFNKSLVRASVCQDLF